MMNWCPWVFSELQGRLREGKWRKADFTFFTHKCVFPCKSLEASFFFLLQGLRCNPMRRKIEIYGYKSHSFVCGKPKGWLYSPVCLYIPAFNHAFESCCSFKKKSDLRVLVGVFFVDNIKQLLSNMGCSSLKYLAFKSYMRNCRCLFTAKHSCWLIRKSGKSFLDVCVVFFSLLVLEPLHKMYQFQWCFCLGYRRTGIKSLWKLLP